MALDTLDVTILTVLAFTIGVVIGLMFGIPITFAMRPRHHHHRTRSLHNGTFSGESLLMSKIDVEPIDFILARYYTATAVDNAGAAQADGGAGNDHRRAEELAPTTADITSA